MNPYVRPGIPYSKYSESVVKRSVLKVMELNTLNSRSRKKKQVLARHVFFYIMRRHSQHSCSEIGRMLDQDHSTVVHGYKRIESEMKLYEHIEKLIEDVKERIQAESSLHG